MEEEGCEAMAAKSWFQSERSNPCFELRVTLLLEKAPEREREEATFLRPVGAGGAREAVVDASVGVDAEPAGLAGKSMAAPVPLPRPLPVAALEGAIAG